MKKILLALALSASLNSFGIMWFDLGVNGGIGTTFPANGNIMDDLNTNYDLKWTGPSYAFGGKIGVNFNAIHSVTPEFLLTSITFPYAHNNELHETPRINYFQIPVMYRKNSDQGGYVEIGPQFSILRNATAGEDTDVSDNFAANTIDLALGGGQYIGGGGALGFNLGVRLNVPLTDMVHADFRNALGSAIYQPADATDFTYKATRGISIMIKLEVNLNIGYLQHGPNCHPGTRFKLF